MKYMGKYTADAAIILFTQELLLLELIWLFKAAVISLLPLGCNRRIAEVLFKRALKREISIAIISDSIEWYCFVKKYASNELLKTPIMKRLNQTSINAPPGFKSTFEMNHARNMASTKPSKAAINVKEKVQEEIRDSIIPNTKILYADFNIAMRDS